MKNLIKIFTIDFSIVLLLISLTACNPFKNQTYEDCILENMKGVKSDAAANEISSACIIKISNQDNSDDDKKCSERILSVEEKNLVRTVATIDDKNKMRLKLHNENKDIVITALKVAIHDIEKDKVMSYEVTNKNIKPFKTSDELTIELLYVPKKYDWGIFDLTTEVCK